MFSLVKQFLRGMVKSLDLSGTYDLRSGASTNLPTNVMSELRMPTVADDVANMRRDWANIGGDMRRALRNHPINATKVLNGKTGL
jgi:hypothetical protein